MRFESGQRSGGREANAIAVGNGLLGSFVDRKTLATGPRVCYFGLEEFEHGLGYLSQADRRDFLGHR